MEGLIRAFDSAHRSDEPSIIAFLTPRTAPHPISFMHNLRFSDAQLTVTWPPSNIPIHGGFRKRMIEIASGKHTEPLSDAALSAEFRDILQSLLANMERVLALLHLPQEVFGLAQRLEKLAQAAARDACGGPAVPPHLHEATLQNYERRREVNALWAPQPDVDFPNPVPFPAFQHEIDRLIDVPWAGVARVGVESLLHAALLGTWTAFESLSTDLWITAVDSRPKTLVHCHASE